MEAMFRRCDRYPARRSHVAMLHYRLSKPQVYNTGGLLSTNGPEWWRLRSAFQKHFSGPQNAKLHVNTMDDVVTEFIDWIKNNNLTVVHNFLPLLNRLNLEAIGAIAFNERFNSFSASEMDVTSRSSKIVDAAFGSNSGIMKLDKGIMWRFIKTPLYNKLAQSQGYLEKVAADILHRKINFFEDGLSDLNDNSLLSSFKNLPNVDLKDITGMMVDILMASIDTTAYTISFVLYHLCRNPECQENLYEELLMLLPDSKCKITMDTLSKATYLKACVKESLRLNPVAIGVGRVMQSDIILKGYKIPKDTVIVTQNMTASRLPKYVRDPLKFKPERWIRDSEYFENLHPFLSLPFGFGPRSCIAKHLAEQNICITIMRLFRAFDMKWIGGELNIKTLLINKPDKPVALKLSRRFL
ncbi:cytochrome P450 302a1, mitochondrial isoform X2 [Leptidea sinapis]|nr:cytochrome P450 302a1, mitochondrial isoform X2 [Leptidea sinapis]